MKKLGLLYLFLVFAVVNASADAVEINGIYYNLVAKTKTAEVTTNPSKYSGEIVIPETVKYEGTIYDVKSIGESAFNGCQKLTSVSIPNSVTSIGFNAFQKCTSLISITIPNSVTSISGYAFDKCSGLTSIIIPNGVTSIGYAAFRDCISLTSIMIPTSILSIDTYAFEGCTWLTSVHISDLGSWCKIKFKSIWSNPLYYAHHLFINGKDITDLVIPISVTSIGEYAFCGCSGLNSVTIPNSLTRIENYSFYDCSGLTSVNIPNSVTEIGYYAFSGCTSLTSITIPNSVTSIQNGAFLNCSSLTSITIPNSITRIEASTFQNCSSVTSVTIGSGVTFIGGASFSSCPEITDVYCYAEKVPILEKNYNSNTYYNPFDGSYIEYAILHVPAASVNDYKAAEPWKNFKSIVDLDGNIPETQKCATPVIIYENGKLTFNSATEGVTFQSTITDEDIKSYSSNEVQLGVTYTISVYATKSGYEDSETVTATLCWIDVEPKTEGISNSVASVRAHAVLIQSYDGLVNISGIDDGSDIVVFSVSGQKMNSAKANGNKASVATNLKKGEIAIVKIGKKSVKVIMQ